jgi:LmbE family N-acetylglucosaminyl deacetylase
MSGIALRAKHELGAEVWVLPFSFGSRLERQAERSAELDQALRVLGFHRVQAHSNGLGELSHGQILSVLDSLHPDCVILPHSEDFHPTHIRCAKAARSAVVQHVESSGSAIALLETEYWQPMLHPNLLIPLPASIVKIMGEALLQHQGEISRNPYHLTLPAWLMDQERRGSERVNGAGGKSPQPSVFSQLYRFTRITSEAGF